MWTVCCTHPKFTIGDNEYFMTPWSNVDIDVTGQRGKEVLVVLAAEPLSPEIDPESEPVFLIDSLTTIDDGSP